ncbi:MAG: hypothetical protein KDH19_19110, partial [Geminicoccaceae bacterium]|nr:hypothetical protein [Geminicoccaceae bacterium]
DVHFTSDGREITNSFFEAVLDEPVAPRVDHREIVWAGWMRIDAIDAGMAQQGLAIYLGELRRC